MNALIAKGWLVKANPLFFIVSLLITVERIGFNSTHSK